MTLEEVLCQLQQGLLTQSEALFEIEKINNKLTTSNSYEIAENLNELEEFAELHSIVSFLLNNRLPSNTEKYSKYSKLSLFKVLKHIVGKIPLRTPSFRDYICKLEAQLRDKESKSADMD